MVVGVLAGWVCVGLLGRWVTASLLLINKWALKPSRGFVMGELKQLKLRLSEGSSLWQLVFFPSLRCILNLLLLFCDCTIGYSAIVFSMKTFCHLVKFLTHLLKYPKGFLRPAGISYFLILIFCLFTDILKKRQFVVVV